MRKYLLVIGLFIGVCCLLPVATTHAESIRIQPLKVQSSLKKGEVKKGFVDITNPTASAVTVKLYVNGFRQINDKGDLEFFDSEQLQKGLTLDLSEFTLGSYQTLRLFYTADGTKLPMGDVFAAIFAQTEPTQKVGAKTALRVGTLVMITNQTPGSRHVEITALDTQFAQFGDRVTGNFLVKNPAPKQSTTGFFPSIKIEIVPLGASISSTGPLVFAGNTRTIDFSIPSNQFGFYSIKVTAADATKGQLIFLVTGWWRLLAPVIMIAAIGGIWIVRKYQARK